MATRLYKLDNCNKYYYGTWQSLTITNDEDNKGWKYAVDYRRIFPTKSTFPMNIFFRINFMENKAIIIKGNTADSIDFDASSYTSLEELEALYEEKS